MTRTPFFPTSEDAIVARWFDATTPSATRAITAKHFAYLVEHLARRVTRSFTSDASVPSHWILASRDPFWVLAGCLAAWSTGARVALPPTLLDRQVTELAAQLGAPLLRSTQTSLLLPDGAELDPSCVDSATNDPRAPLAQLIERLQTQPELLTLWSSGTTGVPQPCPKSGAQLFGEARLMASLFFEFERAAAELPAASRTVLCSVPAHHLYGLLFGALVPFTAGTPLVGGADFGGRPLEVIARAVGATDWISVPAQLQAQLALSGSWLSGLQRVFSSGAPLGRQTARAISERHDLEVVEILGSTETGGIATRTGVRDLWTPLPGVEVAVGNDDRMLLSSPFLLSEREQPLPVPDRIRLVNGEFEHLGRTDGVVKIAGQRVALQEFERAVRELAGVSDVVALALPEAGLRGETIGLVVESRPNTANPVAIDAAIDVAAIRRHLHGRFRHSVLPKRVIVLPELPRDANGKLPRQRLLELFEPKSK